MKMNEEVYSNGEARQLRTRAVPIRAMHRPPPMDVSKEYQGYVYIE
jgi:hypothetical protein